LLVSPRLYGLIGGFDVEKFAQRLWGDVYFSEDQRKFTRKPTDPEANRSFVHFIMEPLYKLYSQVLSEETEALSETLAELGIRLKPVIYKMDVRPLLKVVLDQFFGPSRGLVDMIVEHVPNPVEGALDKVRFYSRVHTVKLSPNHPQVEGTYSGAQTSVLATSMKECNPNGPIMVQVTKLYHTTDAQSFRAFGRILSGTLRIGMEIKVLGEGYSPEDEEDMVKTKIEDIWISESRYGYLCQLEPLCSAFVDTSFRYRRSDLGTLCYSEGSMRPFRRLQH
jgi:116 kDa U5 small nuclear ribonucleoprotein component